MPVKQKRAQNADMYAKALFSKAGVAGWMNSEHRPDKAPGRDEHWRPWHNGGTFFYSG